MKFYKSKQTLKLRKPIFAPQLYFWEVRVTFNLLANSIGAFLSPWPSTLQVWCNSMKVSERLRYGNQFLPRNYIMSSLCDLDLQVTDHKFFRCFPYPIYLQLSNVGEILWRSKCTLRKPNFNSKIRFMKTFDHKINTLRKPISDGRTYGQKPELYTPSHSRKAGNNKCFTRYPR